MSWYRTWKENRKARRKEKYRCYICNGSGEAPGSYSCINCMGLGWTGKEALRILREKKG